MGGASYITLANSVAPGGQATFTANLTAPTTPGTYTGSWQMHNASTSANPYGIAFGDMATVQIVVPQPLVDGGTLVSKTLADGTQENAGSAFTQSWTMRNSGTTTWSPGTYGYTINFTSGSQMGGASYITLANSLAPCPPRRSSALLTAPTTPGTYTGSWQMHNASTSANPYGIAFGD